MKTTYVVMLRVEVDEDVTDDPQFWSWELIFDQDSGVDVKEVSSLRIGDV